MSDPSGALRQLAAQGRQLRAQYLDLLQSRKTTSSRVSAGVGLIDLFFGLSGYKRTATHVGRVLARDSISKQEAALRAQYDAWANAVRAALGEVSLVRGQSPPQAPNSSILLRQFARTRSFARTDVKLAHGVEFLEALADQRLVANQDLAALRASRRAAGLSRERPPATVETPANSVVVEAEEVIRLLEGFPSEREAIEGALAVHRGKGADSGRQALNSCRNGLENLVKRLTGEADWSAGLVKLMPSETRRRTVRQVHSFLSAYGTHGTAIPSEADVRMGFMLTFTAIRSLLTPPGKS